MELFGDGIEKTEPATQRRRQEARERGLVARSADLSASLSLLAAVALLSLCGAAIVSALLRLEVETWSRLGAPALSTAAVGAEAGRIASDVGGALLPLLGGLALVGLLANLLQTGFLFRTAAVAPDASRLSPAQGLRRIVSGRSALQLAMAVLKAAAVAGVVYSGVRSSLPGLAPLSAAPAAGILETIGEGVFAVAARVSLLLLALAVFDYALARWIHGRSLRMTPAEVKEDQRRQEGDPQVRRRRMGMRRAMLKQAVSRDVAGADVVIANPTHLAVALKYDAARMEAPSVVARGAFLAAGRIRDAAARAGVPVVERTPLARELFRAGQVGRPVPEALYRPVAEVLSLIYPLDRRPEPEGASL